MNISERRIKLCETRIPGCYEVHFPVHLDHRGLFAKSYHHSTFATEGLESGFVETFYTVSGENVLRGMHIQLPPADHSKLVYCVVGSVMDVILDVRRGSATFGCYAIIELGAERHNGVYLPRGIAHGFYVRQAPAVMVYHVTSEHVPHLDAGITWDSFGAPWPVRSPLVSERDASLPPFCDFDSPFQYADTGNQPRRLE